MKFLEFMKKVFVENVHIKLLALALAVVVVIIVNAI